MPGNRAAEAVRRGQIIKAAYAVASAKGLDAVTVQDIARKAGISHGLVLFHFETKEQLVVALLDCCSRPRRSCTSPTTSRGFRSPRPIARCCAGSTGCRASRGGFVCSSTSGRRGSGAGDSHEDAPGARPVPRRVSADGGGGVEGGAGALRSRVGGGLSAVAVSFIRGVRCRRQ